MRQLKFNLNNFLKLLCLALALVLSNCKSLQIEDHYTRGSLVSQLLVFRTEYPNKLTNRSSDNIVSYDLTDSNVRSELDKLYFVCTINQKEYHICQDKAGLCRTLNDCAKWKKILFKPDECIEHKQEFLSSDTDLKFLVDANTECKSEIYY